MADSTLIRNISDTALWVAVYRANETKRPDAHFHDPLAEMLAGERGYRIVRELPWGMQSGWFLVVRTCILDEYILRLIRSGEIDSVINLAAGLDTRPYRMDLPRDFQWFEVDLPGILEYKEEKLKTHTPRCNLERFRQDLSDAEGRRKLFAALGERTKKALVITEGLLVYLSEDQVRAIAQDLEKVPSFKFWAFEWTSVRILGWMKKKVGPTLKAGNSELKFGLNDCAAFFGPLGWKVIEDRSMMDEAYRLNRMMPFGKFWRLVGKLFSRKAQREFSKLSGVAILGK